MTSTLDLLIAQVEDPQLRQRLATEYSGIRSRTAYGLVFEDHADEAIRIPRARVARGSHVQPIDEPGPHVYRVRGITSGTATLIRAGEPPREVPVSNLTVARRLGDPVYTGLTPLGEIRQGGGKPAHLVIQGENYHALQTLLYTHEGKVDLIYIDPPYNTGAGDWIYNDRYVGDTDAYRHSKWLAFMDKRLRLAKRLLSPTGVIIVAIDDNEHHRLRLLLDSVFGERNFLMNVAWQGGSKNDVTFNGGGLDYMVAYAKNVDAITASGARWRVEKEGLDDVLAAAGNAWEKSGHDAEEASRLLSSWWNKNKSNYDPGLGDNVKIDEDGTPIKVGDLSSASKSTGFYDINHPVTGLPVPRPARGWAFAPAAMEQMIAEGRVLFGKDHTFSVRKKTALKEMATRSVVPSFYRDRRAAGQHLQKLLGSSDFPYPKDVDVIARWVNIATANNPNAVVLDFFGGTGTTAEAVMRLNAADGGRRQAILVTNNELAQKDAKRLRKDGFAPGDAEWEAEGVFDKVTRPRLETVVTAIRRDGSALSDSVLGPDGKKLASGIAGAKALNENIVFAKLDYLDRTNVELGKQFAEVALLLYAQTGARGRVISTHPERFEVSEHYGILTDVAYRREFAEAVNTAGIEHAYIVVDDTSQYQGVAALLDETVTPHHLYEDYLVNFTINTGAAL